MASSNWPATATGAADLSAATGTLAIAHGGTNSTAALSNNRVMKSASGAVVEAAAITAARALISDANGIPTHSAVTGTELGYVSGVTSDIQTQFTGKQATGNYITALTSDVTASGPGSVAATVAAVGGKTAAAVAQSVTDTVAATSSNTNSTIVKRDGSGNFSAGAISLAADPTTALQAATKQYVDSIAAGLDVKPSVLCATTANITLSGEQTLDGVLTSASRVLVKNQSTPSQNGIYVSASGSWTRATDMDAWGEVPGSFVFVEQGSTYADCAFVCTADSGGTIATTAVTWSQFAGAGTYTAGTGLSLSGTQFSRDVAYVTTIAQGGTGQTAKAAAFDALSPMTTSQDIVVGGASGTGTRVASALLGDVSAVAPSSQAYAVTSASPGVFTVSAHGYLTGDKVYVTVTQNGFTANTTYYVNKTGANTFTLCTTLANAVAGTGITSSGTTAGVVVGGGLVLTSGTKGTVTNDSATAGYVGEYISFPVTGNVGGSSTSALMTDSGASITLTPGDWDVHIVGTVSATCTATGVDGVGSQVELYNNTDTAAVIASLGGFANTAVPRGHHYHHLQTRVSISSSKTYKARFCALTLSGAPTSIDCNIITAASRPFTLFARRVR